MTIAASGAVAGSDAQPTESMDDAIQIDTGVKLAERSMGNISTWKAYLPSVCVDTMIAMGWDKST